MASKMAARKDKLLAPMDEFQLGVVEENPEVPVIELSVAFGVASPQTIKATAQGQLSRFESLSDMDSMLLPEGTIQGQRRQC